MMQAEDSPLINNQESQWTQDGFMTRFDELIRNARTYWEAYEQTENEHIKLFGRCRYKSYESFRDVRRKWIFKKS